MEGQGVENTDGSPIKPVSSLRNHFENIIKSQPRPAASTPTPPVRPISSIHRQVEDVQGRVWGDGRASLDVPRPEFAQNQSASNAAANLAPDGHLFRSGTPRLRPVSMGPLSPPRSPPLVTVESPHSPPKLSGLTLPPGVSARSSRESFRRTTDSRSGSPTSTPARFFKLPSRAATPSLDTRQAPALLPAAASQGFADPQKLPPSERGSPIRSSPHPIPPPINRAGKPKIFGSKPSMPTKTGDSLAPRPSVDDERISPFSTPPSEPESPLDEGMSPPPPIPEHSKPRAPPRPQRDSQHFATPASRDTQQYAPPPPPLHYAEAESKLRRMSIQGRNLGSSLAKLPFRSSRSTEEALEGRPNLPPRRPGPVMVDRSRSPKPPPPPEPPIRRSMDVIGSIRAQDLPGRASMDGYSSGNSTLIGSTSSRFEPPPRRAQTFGLHSQSSHPYSNDTLVPLPPPPPLAPPRPSIDSKRPDFFSRNNFSRNNSSTAPRIRDDSDDDEYDMPVEKGPTLTDYPDSSQANRRPPRFKDSPHEIPTRYETKLFAICGEFVCTGGYITRVWSLLTGEQLLSISHGETTKVTALAFKPAKDVEDEGKRVWLGMNTGELHEVDIPTQSVVISKPNAHSKVPIIKIHRHASDMWTLDDEGKLLVWPTGDDGAPSLASTPNVCRVPSGASFSLIVGSQLWIAFGKDIWIYKHSPESRNATQVLQKPLNQQHVGEVTSGTVISSQTDRIYFGHIDGKVTIYSRNDYSCLGIVSVSLYKISSLVGVGEHLWAGFNTGMIYVYDTTTQPWRVLKDWKAHENTIAGIQVDRTSIWKLDRLQVASLGTDGMIRLWDGMLTDDWLETDMQEHDAEFCDFREVTALVLTWNAGASKPTSLRHDGRDANFFRDLFQSIEPPDIIVFGFQELVDLEDKKVTARSLFKSSKKKDALEHEHMAHQYRAWKDHLTKCLELHMPVDSPYMLLHTASLVGLFTCVFVKQSARPNIRDVEAAKVKLGMGGHYGNKGALIVRFLLDDSSLCFINCHLAAGQRQTVHRNNDIAAIMEAAALPPGKDVTSRADMFVSGGDGTMILDHEICILNGDLNYRIDTMSRDTVIAAVKANNLAKLLDRDQLLLSRKKNPGFRLRAFQEKEITFAPTYKYDVGSDNYDSSEKKRSPAWCDRLLYRGIGRIKQVDYKRHEVRVSDHRPVSGMFKLRVKTISPKRRVTAQERSEQRFEEVRQRIAMDIKLDYLINVFGVTVKEAQRLLAK
ncbi:DNase I-like protein [Trichodelitschia bisporula]|uniref:DNase I-like protein n=1 Tax=Trichodelitschia bisporula TaxID=703511 RepID=A0A6G1I3P5_9PEZI|nr:DNase I-like protein [Trichodelitschia bisporula]